MRRAPELIEEELGPYEIAYLCGGPERVAQLVLVALAADGRIKIATAPHRVRAILREGRDPVEEAALAALPEGRDVLLGRAVVAIGRSAAVTGIAAALRHRGLLRRSRMAQALTPLRLTTRGRSLRHILRAAGTEQEGLGRIAALGPAAISDERLRKAFQTPDPRPPGRRPGQRARDILDGDRRPGGR